MLRPKFRTPDTVSDIISLGRFTTSWVLWTAHLRCNELVAAAGTAAARLGGGSRKMASSMRLLEPASSVTTTWTLRRATESYRFGHWRSMASRPHSPVVRSVTCNVVK